MMEAIVINKAKSHAFGKDVYLLGKDKNGVKYWLEAPKWECGRYWGFGYIETYKQNKNPNKAESVATHSNADKFYPEYFNSFYCSAPSNLIEATFSEEGGWELSELFKQFYFLKEAAENFGRGECFFAETSIETWEKPALVEEINKILIPRVTNRILEILTPIN